MLSLNHASHEILMDASFTMLKSFKRGLRYPAEPPDRWMRNLSWRASSWEQIVCMEKKQMDKWVSQTSVKEEVDHNDINSMSGISYSSGPQVRIDTWEAYDTTSKEQSIN